jgi:flavodoxin
MKNDNFIKPLILYYSFTGNTQYIAQMIQEEIGGDLAQIETIKPYTGTDDSIDEQTKHEVNSGFMPEIKPIQKDISAYNTILIGTPVWWFSFPPAVRTFLSDNSLKGKMVYPFITNGGSVGQIFQNIKDMCPEAIVKSSLYIHFNGRELCIPKIEIINWAKKIRSLNNIDDGGDIR